MSQQECSHKKADDLHGSKKYKAALYLRLSKDDERAGESVSIENQRLLLTKHAEEQGWAITDTYIDDGWSGTNFERPAFRRMLRDAKDRRINLIMVKDMSRLGRNHIEVGRLTDYVFPSLGVRFVAVNDRVDSLQGEDDITAYRNLFNEFLSKDTSRKVRAVKRSCMERGQFLGTYAPLGYIKDPNDKHHLVIDEETAPVIRRIFEMRCHGQSYRAIAKAYDEARIPTPRDIYYRRTGRQTPGKEKSVWSESTVKAILRNEVYIGHMVQGKAGTVSYKNHKQISKPAEQWVRVENTHDPLVSAETWETVRRLDEKNYKPRKDSTGVQSIFAGLLQCADCGAAMRANIEKGTHKDGTPYRYVGFMCGSYARGGKSACTVHTLYERALTSIILKDIREKAAMVPFDERRVAEAVLQAKNRESTAYLATYQWELKAARERLTQLDALIQTLYEDKVRGIISDATFQGLMPKYERERDGKAAAVNTLRDKVEKCEREWRDVAAWRGLIRQYQTVETLTQKVLLELVDRIEVHEAERVGGRRLCRINIVYRFAGYPS